MADNEPKIPGFCMRYKTLLVAMLVHLQNKKSLYHKITSTAIVVNHYHVHNDN